MTYPHPHICHMPTTSFPTPADGEVAYAILNIVERHRRTYLCLAKRTRDIEVGGPWGYFWIPVIRESIVDPGPWSIVDGACEAIWSLLDWFKIGNWRSDVDPSQATMAMWVPGYLGLVHIPHDSSLPSALSWSLSQWPNGHFWRLRWRWTISRIVWLWLCMSQHSERCLGWRRVEMWKKKMDEGWCRVAWKVVYVLCVLFFGVCVLVFGRPSLWYLGLSYHQAVPPHSRGTHSPIYIQVAQNLPYLGFLVT